MSRVYSSSGDDLSQVNERLNKLEHKEEEIYKVEIPESGWNDEYPYTNTVIVPGLEPGMDAEVVGLYLPPEGVSQEEVKAKNKAIACLMTNGSDNAVVMNQITFTAFKRPQTDFTIILRTVRS